MFFSTSTLLMQDGVSLRLMIREMNHPHWLIITHGLGEHAGRYTFLQGLFAQGPNICLYDLRGHGASLGKKGCIDHFDLFAQDLFEVISYLKSSYRMQDFSLFGHSMGGMITADFCMRYGKTTEILGHLKKVFLSSPCVRPHGALALGLTKMERVLEGLSKIELGVKLPLSLFIPLNNLGHDPRVIQEYKNDSLNTQFFHTSFILKLVHYCTTVWNKPFGIDVPIRASIGAEDHIVSVVAFKKYFKKYETNAQIRIFPGAYHEMHNEIIRLRRPFLEYLYEFIMDYPLEYKVS